MGVHVQAPTSEDLLCLECTLPDCDEHHPECRLHKKRRKTKEYNHKYYSERREKWNT